MKETRHFNESQMRELAFYALDNSMDPIFWTDSDSAFVYVNNAACLMLGYDKEELLEMDVFDVDSEFPRESWPQVWGSLKETGHLEFESRHRKKNGEIINVAVNSTYLVKNSLEYNFSFARDITSQKRNEKLLLESENTYRRLFKSFPLPAFTWHLEKGSFILADFNDIAESGTEGRISEYAGMSAEVFFEKNPFVVEMIEKCLSGKKIQTMEREYLTRITGKNSIMRITAVYISNQTVILYLEDVTEIRQAERELKNLARFPEENPNPVFRIDINRKVRYQNSSSIWLLSKWIQDGELKLPDVVCSAVSLVSESRENMSLETKVGERLFHFTITLLEDTEEVYFYGTDVTETRMAQEELILAGKVLETTTEGLVVTDAENRIIMVNPAFSVITGFTEADAIGQNPRILKSDRHTDDFYIDMWRQLGENGKWEGEIWNRKKNGESYPEWLSINVVKGADGAVKNYVSVFRDITEIKESQKKIKYQAYHDPLTKLPNRYLFMDRVNQAISHARRDSSKAAVLFMDIDRFKVINDSLGHVTGDSLLEKVASILESAIRESDTVARIGGDEFTILLPQISDESDILKVLHRILAEFSSSIIINDKTMYVTPSIGVSIYPGDGETQEELYKNADMAMYQAKALGGNTYHFFSSDLNVRAENRFALETGIRRALEKREFELYYQPIIDPVLDRVRGVEALIRWNSPGIGVVSPANFIPVAEETGLIIPINEWVFNEAVEFVKKITLEGYRDLYISINLTSHQFEGRRIMQSVSSGAGYNNNLFSRIVIEITENSIMKNTAYIISQMKELKELGFRFSIDDFGTGYSSLGYLRKFPINYLKIDRSFLTDVPAEAESNSIVRTILALSRELGIESIAEGVEVAEQLAFLQNAGRCSIQGYYYSRPLPYNELLVYLSKGKNRDSQV